MRSRFPCVAVLPLSLWISLATVSLAWGQFDALGGNAGEGLLGGGDEPAGVVKISARFSAPEPGKPAHLFVTAAIQEGWHIYSITQPAGGPVRTKIKLQPSAAFRLLADFRPITGPEKKKEPAFDNLLVESHQGTATWYSPIELSSGIDAAALKIRGEVTAQPCDADSCLPPQQFPFTAALGPGLPLSAMPAPLPAANPPNVDRAQGPSTAARIAFDPHALVIAENKEIQQMSLGTILFWGFLGGLILNVMPCVLPVIGLKVLSFVEQAGHDRRAALMLNVWYSLGLMSVFLVLATLAAFLGYGWGELFGFQSFSITMAAVVFVMALSFLGVWEMPIPGFVGRGTAVELAQREGAAGAFSKGVLATILATPCGAPLLASAFTWTVTQPPANTYAVFFSLGFGMASPYLLIGAFPGLIRFLPKPGEWMETFKQIMGFVLLATVVFLLTFIRLEYILPTVALLFGLWGSCWWIGRVGAAADLGRRFRAWLGAAAFAVLVWVIAFPGLDKLVPSNYAFGLYDMMRQNLDQAIDQGVAQRLAPLDAKTGQAEAATAQTAAREASGETRPHELPWQPFTRQTFEQSVAAGQTVLVDFTADWCLTCKALEAGVLNTQEVRELVDNNRVLTYQADWTHLDPEVTEMLQLLGSKQVPVVAIFPANDPNRPTVLRGGYTQRRLLEALEKAGPSRAAPDQPLSAAAQARRQ